MYANKISALDAGLLNKSSCSAAALGVAKLITINAMSCAHFVVLLMPDLDVQPPLKTRNVSYTD